MTKDEIKLFKRFIKENGVYGSYLKQYDPNFAGIIYGFLYSANINKFLTCISNDNPICDAFSWRDSKEGLEFWRMVESKWEDCLMRINTKLEYDTRGNKTI